MTEQKKQIPYHVPLELSEEDKSTIKMRLDEILKTGQLTNGGYVKELERKIREMYDVEYCIATSNCTMGLYLCCLTTNSLLHMPAFTWISPYLTNTYRDIDIHDIEKNTWLMESFKAKYRDIIMPCHTFGNVIPIEEQEDIYIFVDGAHALGSELNGIGTATVFSLAPTKLVTSCEGGLIITNDKKIAEFVEYRRDKCVRLSEIHAIIGLQTLTYLDQVKEWKIKVRDFYAKKLPGLFQDVPYDSNFNTVGFLNTEDLKIPDHIDWRQYYEPLPYTFKERFPNTFGVYNQIVCLPSYYNCPYEQIVKDILEVNEL